MPISQEAKAGAEASAEVRSGAGIAAQVKMHTHWRIVAGDPDGKVKWIDEFDNLVVNEGLDDLLDNYLKGSGYTAAFYVGITGTSPSFAAGDTMGSHDGWTEVTAYNEVNRPDLTLGSVSGQSVDNSASKASFTIDTNDTGIGGAFVATDNEKGGSGGTLYGGAALSAGDKQLDDDDTLEVTVTLTAAAS